jgi:hypothetical protein
MRARFTEIITWLHAMVAQYGAGAVALPTQPPRPQ